MKTTKAILASILCASLCACSKVPAGHKGVIVNLYGSDKGVSEQVVGTGYYYMGWTKQMYLFLQNHTWTEQEAITMQTSEGLSLSTDVGITYNILPENVSKVFQKYRLGVDEITDTFLHNMVRDAMNQVSSTMTVEQLYGEQKPQFIAKVNDQVKKEAARDGIQIDKVYLIGSFRLPATVIDSINAKIQATQNAMKVQNEVATAQAEAQKTIVVANAKAKRILIEAEAKAKANELISKSLTQELISYQALQRWDGHLPKVNSSTIPFIDAGKYAKE
jgi:regulator of protease activity HflC (stomatin/prohibitin superfamily)